MQSFTRKHPLLWAYLFSAFFSLSYHLPIYCSGMSGSTGLRQTLLMSGLWLIPMLLLPVYTRRIAALAGLLMWPAALTSVFYFIIYGQEFSQSAIFIAFESNLAESSEFIQSYWRWWFVPLLLVFAAVPVWMWTHIQPLTLRPRQRLSYAAGFTLIGCWPLIASGLLAPKPGLDNAIYHQMVRMEPAAPWNVVMGYVKYRQQVADMNHLLELNRQVQPLQNLMPVQTLPDTVVLVIGESTNRQRMSLYGYDRATTPHLDALRARDELLVFNDVVTPRPYTIEALQQILSFADSQHPERFFTEPTLLNMMKQAGYDITWITNQQTQTRRNTMLTTFSQMADHQVYLNNNRQQNASQYDEVVLAPFAGALAAPAPKKLIIVHLLGTHRVYKYRYPEAFARYRDKTDVPAWISADLLEEYNSYDDAIRYNDQIVATLIDTTRAQDDSSLLVYFADHGEEVYDTPAELFTGRNEGAPTSAMYTVPFMVWTSPQFKQQRDTRQWQAVVDRPYSNAYFIYTFAELVGLEFTGMDYAASLVSDQFKAMPRWIGDPLQPKTLRDYSVVSTTADNIRQPPAPAVKTATATDLLQGKSVL